METIEIREVTSPEELEKIFQVIRQLREHLSFQDFTELYDEARRADQFTLVGAFLQDQCVGAMGYRTLFDFLHGKHLYIDDLVTSQAHRSHGIGAKLLKHAENQAAELQCQSLRLCTGIDLHPAQRFYEREGWQKRSVAYKKKGSITFR